MNNILQVMSTVEIYLEIHDTECNVFYCHLYNIKSHKSMEPSVQSSNLTNLFKRKCFCVAVFVIYYVTTR